MNTCCLNDLDFPYTKYCIKGSKLKIQFCFRKQEFPGVFQKLRKICFPLFLEKNEGKILSLDIDQKQYKVAYVDSRFEESGIHLDPDIYKQEMTELYNEIVDDPAPFTKALGVEDVKLDYVKGSKEWEEDMKQQEGSGYLVFQIK